MTPTRWNVTKKLQRGCTTHSQCSYENLLTQKLSVFHCWDHRRMTRNTLNSGHEEFDGTEKNMPQPEGPIESSRTKPSFPLLLNIFDITRRALSADAKSTQARGRSLSFLYAKGAKVLSLSFATFFVPFNRCRYIASLKMSLWSTSSHYVSKMHSKLLSNSYRISSDFATLWLQNDTQTCGLVQKSTVKTQRRTKNERNTLLPSWGTLLQNCNNAAF